MKKEGSYLKAVITQREQIDMHGVEIDMLESNYVRYFENLGFELFPLSNFTLNLDKILKNNQFDLIILTGGGSIQSKFYKYGHSDFAQENRDKLEWKLMEYSTKEDIPILAICRGMQYINAYLGGEISKLLNLKEDRPIGKDHSIILSDGTEILVNNYHNDGIYANDLGETFKILGLDIENEVIEAIYSEKMKWLGLQWHPERIMNDIESRDRCKKLIQDFSKNGGIIDEGYYFSSRTRD